MGDQPDWRPVVAALSNPHAREVFAQITLGHETEDLGAGLGSARRRGVLTSLVKADLVRETDGGFEVRGETFASLLGAQSRPGPAAGPARFFDGAGMIDRYPRAAAEMEELLRFVAERVLAAGEVLTEAELNGRLRVVTSDPALLRRHLVDHGVVERTPSGSEYALAQ